jgi:hypothetical protein
VTVVPERVQQPDLGTAPSSLRRRIDELRDEVAAAPFIGPGAGLDKGLEYVDGIVDYSLRLAMSDDPRRPHLIRTSGVRRQDDPTSPSAVFRRNGLDNPDNDYLICSIDPAHDYVVEGERGTICEINFQLLDGNYSDRTDAFASNLGILASRDVPTDASGRFELTLSSDVSRATTGLVLPPMTKAVIVRQSHVDWGIERPGAVRIRRVGDPDPDQVQIDEAYWSRVDAYLHNTIRIWLQFGPGVEAILMAANGPKNRPYNEGAAPRRTPGGFPDQFSMAGRFKITDGQALVVTMDPSGAAYHGIQLGDYWFTSLHYLYRQSSLNASQYVRDDDGSVSVVISRTDLGVANWLDTCGLDEGYFFVRWQGLADGVEPHQPTVTLVELVDLDRGTAGGLIDPAERSACLARRVASFGERERVTRDVDFV